MRPPDETKRMPSGKGSVLHSAWVCNDEQFERRSKRMDGPGIRPYHFDKCFPSAFTPPGSEYIFSS